MKRQKPNKSRYFNIGIITAFIFLLGILFGSYVDSLKYGYVEEFIEKQKLDLNSLQVQTLFILSLESNQSCSAMEKVIENNLKTLQPVLIRLIEYEEGEKNFDESYINIKREYIQANTRYYILADRSRELCNSNYVPVLYFFDSECELCKWEGSILTDLRIYFNGSLLVFPVDSDFREEPLVDVLLKTYNVTSYPTLVIDGEIVKKYLPKEELKEKICSKFLEETNKC
jgi:thiol-disulfide isomerase/thioredoxin